VFRERDEGGRKEGDERETRVQCIIQVRKRRIKWRKIKQDL